MAQRNLDSNPSPSTMIVGDNKSELLFPQQFKYNKTISLIILADL